MRRKKVSKRGSDGKPKGRNGLKRNHQGSIPSPSKSHSFSDKDLGNWEIAYSICAVTPEEQLAREFHTEQNWAAIGHAYGSEYEEPFNIAPEEGCMVALKNSEAEREAAFKMMEAAEGSS